MKTFNNTLLLLFSILCFLSCSNDDEEDKPCEDLYIVPLFSTCESEFFKEIAWVSIEEGERIKELINATSKSCIAISTKNSKGENFEGFVRKDTEQDPISFFDCSEFCILCDWDF